jgi:hypothetical protein
VIDENDTDLLRRRRLEHYTKSSSEIQEDKNNNDA